MQMFYVETKNATEVVKEEECVSSEQENEHFKLLVPMPKKKKKKTKNIDVQNAYVSSSAESQSPVQLSILPEEEISIQNASVSSSALGFEADVSQDLSFRQISTASSSSTDSEDSEDTSNSGSYVSHYSSSSENEHESSFEQDTPISSRAPGTKKKASRLSYSASEVDISPLNRTSNVQITPFSPTKETTDDGQSAHAHQCEVQSSPENEPSNAGREKTNHR